MKLIEQSLAGVSVCPHCGGTGLYRWDGLQRYRCCHCKRTFNALTHTPLGAIAPQRQVLNYERAMVQALSIRQTATHCGVVKNTHFKWRHRFLSSPATRQPAQMSGIVEADETFFLESFKGKRHYPAIAQKRGGKAAKRGTSAVQTPVLVVRDRHGE